MRTNFCIGDCRSYFVVILLVFAMQSCNGDQEGDSEGGPQAPIELAENEFVLIDGSNGFAFDLFAQVCASEEGNNVFLSPLSVALVFGMAHTGAVGDTAATIRSAFGFDDMNSDEINQSFKNLAAYLESRDEVVTLELGNALWSSQGYEFSDPFMDSCVAYYEADQYQIGVDDPTQWAFDVTHGMIDDFELASATYLALVNAIYFKGTWTYQFSPTETITQTFYAEDGSEVDVPMMTAYLEVPFAVNEEISVVELPYGNEQFAMTLIKPTDGVNDYIGRLTQESFDLVRQSMNVTVTSMLIPKFEINFKAVLNDPLTALGLGPIFGSSADFGGISPGQSGPDGVKQISAITVDEEGTEASAVTSMEFGMSMSSWDFFGNRPLVFVIHERGSGAILFMGKLANPLDAE